MNLIEILKSNMRIKSAYFYSNSRLQSNTIGPTCHYANTPMQYTAIFHSCKNVNFQMKDKIFFLFLLKILIVGTH